MKTSLVWNDDRMKKKNIYISDLNHKKFLIKDLKKFKQHINLYHGRGSTIHEEDGFIFKVDDNFRKKINSYEEWIKNIWFLE